jgi:thioredoxin 1
MDELERIRQRKMKEISDAKRQRQGQKGGTVTATDATLDAVIKGSDICVVDFWAEWCGPCKMMSPIIEELAGQHKEVLFCKVDVDKNIATAQKFEVMSIPTLIFFKNGKMVDTLIGAVPKTLVEQKLAKYLERAPLASREKPTTDLVR